MNTSLPPHADMAVLGAKIREFRKMRQLTVRRLADEAETSPSMISQIENGKAAPGFANLVRIANALGVSLGDLVSEGQVSSSSRVVRQADRPHVKWGTQSKKYLITPRPFKHVEAYELDMAAGDRSGQLTYGDTSVLVIVTAGRGSVQVNQEVFELTEGDSLSFCTAEPHEFANLGATPFRAIFVLTPPATAVKGDATATES